MDSIFTPPPLGTWRAWQLRSPCLSISLILASLAKVNLQETLSNFKKKNKNCKTSAADAIFLASPRGWDCCQYGVIKSDLLLISYVHFDRNLRNLLLYFLTRPVLLAIDSNTVCNCITQSSSLWWYTHIHIDISEWVVVYIHTGALVWQMEDIVWRIDSDMQSTSNTAHAGHDSFTFL